MKQAVPLIQTQPIPAYPQQYYVPSNPQPQPGSFVIQPAQQVAYQPVQQVPYQPTQQLSVQQVQPMTQPNRNEDQNALILLILGFFCSICWIINSCAYKKSPSEKARKYARISLLLFFIWMSMDIICTILYFVYFSALYY